MKIPSQVNEEEREGVQEEGSGGNEKKRLCIREAMRAEWELSHETEKKEGKEKKRKEETRKSIDMNILIITNQLN